jgi:hypothetical protein
MSAQHEVSRSRIVEAVPDYVWSTLAAFEEISSWAKGVDHSAITSAQKQGVGATRRVQAGRVTVLETIVEWSPPTRLAYAIEGLPKVVRGATNSWQLEPADGRTRVTLTSRVDPGSRIGGRIAAAVIARLLGRVSDRLLDGLAAHCNEHSAAATQS